MKAASAAALMTAVLVAAPQASFAADGLTYSSTVFARSFKFLGVPSALPAGTEHLTFNNIAQRSEHEFINFNLGPKCAHYTLAQAIHFVDSVHSNKDAQRICPGIAFEGAAFATAGHSFKTDIKYTPGRTLYACFIRNKQSHGVPHYKLGMIGLIQVQPAP